MRNIKLVLISTLLVICLSGCVALSVPGSLDSNNDEYSRGYKDGYANEEDKWNWVMRPEGYEAYQEGLRKGREDKEFGAPEDHWPER